MINLPLFTVPLASLGEERDFWQIFFITVSPSRALRISILRRRLIFVIEIYWVSWAQLSRLRALGIYQSQAVTFKSLVLLTPQLKFIIPEIFTKNLRDLRPFQSVFINEYLERFG